MPFSIVITHAGRAALVNAANTGTGEVEITQIGLSQDALVPLETMLLLPGEFKRLGAIAGQIVADDVIHVTLKDESSDAYTLRSLALYLGDGTMFAVAGQADPILIKSPSAIPLIAFDIAFADVSAALITFGDTDFALPSATVDRQGIVELATNAEAQAGADAVRALTPAAARAAVLGWIKDQDGPGSGLDADLLDGQNGAWYADIAARLGFTPLAALAYTAADVLAKLLGVDGSGSGLDADTVDGKHASAFAQATDFGFPAVGAFRLPGGFCIQWGSGLHSDGTGIKAVVWPAPMNPFMAIATNSANSPPAAFHGTGNFTTTGMTVYSARSTSVASPAGTAFNWIAIGILI
ncbi:MAG: gp53-like domain-containing protein [Novosphingobium sp.]